MFNLLTVLASLVLLASFNVKLPNLPGRTPSKLIVANSDSNSNLKKPKISARDNKPGKVAFSAYIVEAEVPPELLISPTLTPVPTIVPENKDNSGSTWGKARQLSEHTWTIDVGQDGQMASPQEILNALNNYRKTKGREVLSMDHSLASYSQTRADLFNKNQKLDDHAGFMSYFTQDKIREMGLRGVGENSAVGYTLSGTHLIEWVFAADAPHDNNQLNSSWNVVGIATSGNAVNLDFGAK